MKEIQYWHMQIHPTDTSFAEENVHSILEHKKIIGLGDWEAGKETIASFKNTMKVNDVVAIKTGKSLVALVQVIGGWYEVRDDNSKTCWIIYRRPIRVLDWATKNETIPHALGTLNQCVTDDAPTTKIIKTWHSQIETLYTKRKLDIYV